MGERREVRVSFAVVHIFGTVEDDDVIKPHDLKSYENPLFGLGETAKYKLDIDIGYGRGLDSVDKAEEVAAIVQVCTGKDSDQECESMV